jgi:hypothetical protein
MMTTAPVYAKQEQGEQVPALCRTDRDTSLLVHLVYQISNRTHLTSFEAMKRRYEWGAVKLYMHDHPGCVDPSLTLKSVLTPLDPPKDRPLMREFLTSRLGDAPVRKYFRCHAEEDWCENGFTWRIGKAVWHFYVMVEPQVKNKAIGSGACVEDSTPHAKTWTCWDFDTSEWSGELHGQFLRGDINEDFYGWPGPNLME